MKSLPNCKKHLAHLCLILLVGSFLSYIRTSGKVKMFLLPKAGTSHKCHLSLNFSTYSPPPELCPGAEEFCSLGSVPQLFSLLQLCCQRSRAQPAAGTGMAACFQQSFAWEVASVMLGVEMREFHYYSPNILHEP